MNQMDDENANSNAPDSKYENILKNTLLKRTGRNFKRNVEAAFVPQQDKEAHEDVANRIFDNIIKRKEERLSAQADAIPEPEPEDPAKAYADILDDILFAGNSQQDYSQQTYAESNPLAIPKIQPIEVEPEAEPAPYQSILHRTLNQRKQGISRNGKARIESVGETLPPLPELPAAPLSHHYSDALDEILGFNSDAPSYPMGEDPSLSQTVYNQKLDDLLWPSQQKAAKAARPVAVKAQPEPEQPPVDEAKIRGVIADYLKQLIFPEGYGLIAVQRRVLDERYSVYWVRETMHQLSQTLQSLEVDFSIWLLNKNLVLLKHLISVDFIARYRMMIEQMLPPIKPVSPFNRKKNESSSLIDRMSDNKFEDVRRLLKANKSELTDEELLIFFNFFKQKLPEFFKKHHQVLAHILVSRSEEQSSNPFVASFLAAIFFSSPFEAVFQSLHENEDRYKQTWHQFLRDKSESMVNKSDPIVPLILMGMELFHEKAAFFRKSERETLHQALELLEGLMRFLSEDYFNKEDLLKQFQNLLDTRVQAQFHVEAQALQALGQEIAALAYQQDQGARIRASHLTAIYERHNKEMSDTYHKRRDTAEKLSQGNGPATQNRKQFIQRKLKACQQYLQKHASRQAVSVEVPYREYSSEFLAQKQKELTDSYQWDNEYESEILHLAFEKANMVLKSLNNNKSTVKFNLKVLFDGEPEQDAFLLAFAQAAQQLHYLQANSPQHATLNYLQAILHRYFTGLRLPDISQYEAYLTGPARTGYIVSYLGHVSHIKLLVNLQFQQVIYDFETLFEIAHALHMLDMAYAQPALSFEEHYRQTLLPTWNCILSYCLIVGSGQYSFVSNPLALHDYTWLPPVSFGFSDFGEDDEDFLSMGEPDDMVRFPALQAEVLPQESTDDFSVKRGKRKLFGAAELDPIEEKPVASDSDDEYGVPSMPSMPSRRRLPVSPGKFEMYNAPTRRAMPAANQFEEDNLYSVLSQNASRSETEPPALKAPDPKPPEDNSFVRPRSMMDLDEPAPAKTFIRPRSLAGDDTPQAPPVKPSPAKAPAQTPESESNSSKRKRWLEITPVPQEGKNYDDMLDSILDSWDQESPPPEEPDESLSVVEQILKRNRLDPNMQSNGGTTISPSLKRRRLDDDY